MLTCAQGNLGGQACNQVVRLGVLVAGVTLALGLFAIETEYATALGWLLALPLSAAAYFIISGLSGLCIYQGLRRQRLADHGPEAVLDREKAKRLRLKSILVVTASLAIGSGFAAFVAGAGTL